MYDKCAGCGGDPRREKGLSSHRGCWHWGGRAAVPCSASCRTVPVPSWGRAAAWVQAHPQNASAWGAHSSQDSHRWCDVSARMLHSWEQGLWRDPCLSIWTSCACGLYGGEALCELETPKLCFAPCRTGGSHTEACSRHREHSEARISGEEVQR